MGCSATNEKSDSIIQKEREKFIMNETNKDNNPYKINISENNTKCDSNVQKEREKFMMNETDKDNNPNKINLSLNNTKSEKENNKIDLPIANTKKELLKNLNSSNDENKSLLLKIKSKHIFKKIQEFFNQVILFKLVVHSKILQQKLNYDLFHYQNYYYSKI